MRRIGLRWHLGVPCAVLGFLLLTGCPPKETPNPPPGSGGPSTGSASPAGGSSTPAAPPNATAQAISATAAGYPAGTAEKPDPVTLNGPIFVGWSVPKLALVFSGEQLGYLEPCGCAGLENQKGGMSRRDSLLRMLREQGWPVVALDNGGLVRRYGRQADIKFEWTVEALRRMQYGAVGLGPQELHLPAGTVVAAASTEPSPFVSANVGLFGFEAEIVPRFRVLEAGELKIGVTSVIGDSLLGGINNPDVQTMPAERALAEVLPKLEEAKCDRLVLLAHASPDESRALAARFPQFHVVVTAGGADEPPHDLRKIEGTETALVEVGHKGMYTVVLGFYDDPAQPVRYQRVPLDARFADSPAMKSLLVAYQDQLKVEGFEGLGLRALAHPRTAGQPAATQFVGAQTCGKCHTEAMAVWTKSKHAHATESLMKLDPPRHYDPECLSCHVTGWSPQEYTMFEGGFLGSEATPHLTANSCENCHGPGRAHVEAEEGKNLVLRAQWREAMKLTRATAEEQLCIKCHDPDNSPKFNFATFWPKVEHKGKK